MCNIFLFLFFCFLTAPIDIQSILNGAAKFCRHCDVVILNNLIKKKASEMPFLAREDGSEDFYFCSTACMQLALLHHHPPALTDKVCYLVIIIFILK